MCFHESGLRRRACGLIGIDTSTRWVLFPTLPFPFSDFRAVVDAHFRIGRSGLLGEFMSRRRKPAEETGNQTLVGSGVPAVGLGSSYLDLEFGF